MNNGVTHSYFVIRMPQTMVLFVIRKLLSISQSTVSFLFLRSSFSLIRQVSYYPSQVFLCSRRSACVLKGGGQIALREGFFPML